VLLKILAVPLPSSVHYDIAIEEVVRRVPNHKIGHQIIHNDVGLAAGGAEGIVTVSVMLVYHHNPSHRHITLPSYQR
jgi:hypothetical protein